jgi:AraC-like DNA-binding protein
MADPENALSNLEKAMHLSQMQLYRKLKALSGLTPTLFIRKVRLQKARELLLTTDLNVSEIAYQVGFNDPAYFSRAFNEEFGTPPSEIRN